MTEKKVWGLWIVPGISRQDSNSRWIEFSFRLGVWKPGQRGRFFITHPEFSSAMDGFDNQHYVDRFVGRVMAIVDHQKKEIALHEFRAHKFGERGLHFARLGLEKVAENKIKNWLRREYPGHSVSPPPRHERIPGYRAHLIRRGLLGASKRPGEAGHKSGLAGSRQKKAGPRK